MVRMHNIEHEYYLALSEISSGWRKRFFLNESRKLKRFEPFLKHADLILAIKAGDAMKLQHYGVPVHILPASLMLLNYSDHRESEPFCLYHGNLSVPENERAVEWLIHTIFKPLNRCHDLKVAGKNPGEGLVKICSENGVELISNPEDVELNDLLDRARVHVFYSEQATGVKLKLLRALASSGHVIVNSKMIEGTDLLSFCDLALIEEDYREMVEEKLQEPLTAAEFEIRRSYLQANYDTEQNCLTLAEKIPHKPEGGK